MTIYTMLLTFIISSIIYPHIINSQDIRFKNLLNTENAATKARGKHANSELISESEVLHHNDGTTTDPCVWTSPKGHHFDLRALQQENMEGFQLFSSNSEDHTTYTYDLGICEPPTNIPTSCKRKYKREESYYFTVGYQSSKSGCWSLGDLHTAVYELIDENDAQKGIQLSFTDGTRCADGFPRSIRYHFICTGDWKGHGGQPYYVTELIGCEYEVVWPTHHACPAYSFMDYRSWFSSSPGTSYSLFSTMWYLFLCLLFYCIAGIAWNVHREKKAIGIDAIPHKSFWTKTYVVVTTKSKMLLQSVVGSQRFAGFIQRAQKAGYSNFMKRNDDRAGYVKFTKGNDDADEHIHSVFHDDPESGKSEPSAFNPRENNTKEEDEDLGFLEGLSDDVISSVSMSGHPMKHEGTNL